MLAKLTPRLRSVFFLVVASTLRSLLGLLLTVCSHYQGIRRFESNNEADILSVLKQKGHTDL